MRIALLGSILRQSEPHFVKQIEPLAQSFFHIAESYHLAIGRFRQAQLKIRNTAKAEKNRAVSLRLRRNASTSCNCSCRRLIKGVTL
jgi:hypothetical protein